MKTKILLTLIFLSLSSGLMAQNAEQLYNQGKALYDAGKFTQAFPIMLKSAEKGNKKAQYRLGRMYDKGEGVHEDNKKAFAWYLKAATQGHPKAQFQVGRCYKKGKAVAKDPEKAFKYFLSSARQDCAAGQVALAKHYYYAGDMKKAKQWATKGVNNPKKGDEELTELRREAAQGEVAATALLKMIGK